MPTFSVRVSDDAAARFDAAAAPHGGRSARLRQLIHRTAASVPPAAAPGRPVRRDGARIMVRLDGLETAGLDAEATVMGMPRATWIAALIGRRLRGRPTFGRADELSLLAIQTELRRIGVNVNQIARALNTAVMTEGRVLDLELAYLDDLRAEIRGHMTALREAFEGNLAYWDAGP